jgi:putative ABC transport system permease protein
VNSSMSASFIGTVRDQLTQSFARDFNVQAQGYNIDQGGGPGVPATLRRKIAAMPETGVVTPVRVILATLPNAGDEPGMLMAWDPSRYGQVNKEPVRGASRADAYAGVAHGGVILGSMYASRAKLDPGDRLTLTGPGGTVNARVAGTVDTQPSFNIQMSLATMKRVYGVATDAQLAVKAKSDKVAPVLERKLNALIDRRYQNLELVSAAGRKAEIEKEISQQFNFFNAIVIIAVIGSLLGVVNTLAMSVLERTREIGVLRALGSSRWLVRRTMVDESLLITLAGAAAGILAGLVIGFVWISGLGSVMPGIAFHLPLTTIVVVAVASVIAGVVAAALPARRAARLNVIEALTYE